MAEQFSDVVNQFSVDLYQTCIEGKSCNVILSPLSVQTALSLALMGAKGKTADEMISVMKFGGITRDQVADHYQNFMDEISKSSTVKLANKIYVQEKYTLKNEFKEIATKKFNSDAENVDFNKKNETSKQINEWVESKTNNKIKDLIKPDMLDSLTRMILVNAIYFKGEWEHKFNKNRTGKDKFYLNETDSIEVDMMRNKEKYNFGKFDHLDATGIEMKYSNSDISMFILLPNKRTGLAKLEADLKNIKLSDLTKEMCRLEVELTLPKFKIEFEMSLKEVLAKMGMSTMFSTGADFSDLLESPEPLQVDDVVHKAFIEVNEEGAEAAAATGVIMMARCMPIPMPPTIFNADHPFIYILKHSKNQACHFMGRINHPVY